MNDIEKLDNVTWYGHCVIHGMAAISDLPDEAKLLPVSRVVDKILRHGFSLPSALNQSDRSRRIRVLDLDPVRRAPGAIRPIAALRDDAFEPHDAGVSEQRRSVDNVRRARRA
jgi:hypothetical protein